MISLRPRGFDELGLRRALSDRMVPLVVAAMSFLAALALAGWFGTAALSRHWRQGAGATLTVQVPQAAEPSARADQPRLAAVLGVLSGTPGVASAHALSDQELDELLRPWFGQGADRLAVPIPAVIAVRLRDSSADRLEALSRRLKDVAPGTLVEDHGIWIRRLSILAKSLQACAALVVLLVATIAAAVVAVATRAGLSTRRQAIEIVHGMGATDRYIASRFAGRAMWLAASGALAGAAAALPVLLTLAQMAAPFAGEPGRSGDAVGDVLGQLPTPLWLALPCLPIIAAIIGYATAHGAVRRWLLRLP